MLQSPRSGGQAATLHQTRESGKSIDLTLCNPKREIDVLFFDPPEFGKPLPSLKALNRRGRASDDDSLATFSLLLGLLAIIDSALTVVSHVWATA